MNAKQRYDHLCAEAEKAAREVRYYADAYCSDNGDDPQLMRAARRYADAMRDLRNEGRPKRDRRVLKGRRVSK